MGSVPPFSMYFTTSRLSNTWLDTGERTGSSGTSLQTKAVERRSVRGYASSLEACLACKKLNSLEQISAIFPRAKVE